jgi:hypothetical protein
MIRSYKPLGGIIIKRILLFLFALILFTGSTACSRDRQVNSSINQGGEAGDITDIGQDKTGDEGSDISEASDDEDGGQTNPKNEVISDIGDNNIDPEDDVDGPIEPYLNREFLQSASVDLNGDGINEQVTAVKITLDPSDSDTAVRLEGWLEIEDGDTEKEVVFWKKGDNLSGLMTSMQFEDMDGDGSKDIFIIVPDYGASFAYSNCFIYSYKKDRSCVITSDNELAEFINGFSFAYVNRGNKLSIINERFDFSADIIIEDGAFSGNDEETMLDYAQGSWIDPTCVDISEESKLTLTKGSTGAEVKVPLPIFGMATVNMIGEIDLYYTIDASFSPVLKRCEIIDFDGGKKVEIGSIKMIN